MIHQIKTWIASAVALIQDSLSAPADINGPGFDDGVAVLTRVLCERELRQSVWQRLLGMRPTADEAELLGLQQEFERLEDLLMALQQRLASVIDARMSVRQKWGRYDFFYSLPSLSVSSALTTPAQLCRSLQRRLRVP
jgi:hypothetical protein